MAPELGDGLCGLCRGRGWSYGVFYRVDRRDPRLLVMEDSHYEEQIGKAIDKMITQVHMVGEGTIGAAAISGKHQWFYLDTYCEELSPTSFNENADKFQGKAEWHHQLLAGIKTIAVISLPSIGVVQFGSTQKICESLEFVNQVRHFFQQLQTMTDHLLQEGACKAVDTCHPCEAFASVISSHDTSSKNVNSLHDIISKELQANAQSSTGLTLSSDVFSFGSHSGSTDSHLLPMSAVFSPTDVCRSFSNPFQKLPASFLVTDQRQSSCSAEAQMFSLPNMWSDSMCPNNLGANLNANTWAKELATLPMLEQSLPRMATNSRSSVLQVSPIQYFSGGSNSFHSKCGSQDMIHNSGKLLDFQHSSSSLSFSMDGLSTAKSSFDDTSFELPDNFLTYPQESTPEPSPQFQYKDDQINDHIHLCDQMVDQVNDGFAGAMKDSIISVQIEAVSPSAELPGRPVEDSVGCSVNSLDRGCDWKEASSDAPTQLPSDNDLFEGMELDLSPSIPRQECWDDIIMPVGGGSCSNLSTSVSDCISDMDLGSVAVADKGLFSESSFEQLLEAVVGRSANISSSHNPAPINASSVASIESENQFSATGKVGGPQVYIQKAPPRGLPSLPGCNLGKIMQGSSKEALLKSHVGAWIDDSCSMSTHSAVTNQPKKPEETAKAARKRARPGESTRPRPKDRQQIQDRVKELREIVPNSAKCSIDSLLDRTIKHMLFLQSVTKYADKLRRTDEPKMIGEESGVILKDNSSNGSGSGGATWAYEVAGQTMVCPILVEDLNPPGQMLVEMLCEERGFFLEIADIIRGFGLTILRGVMEIRNRKIWARFLVEANRDVTRMDIFLSLVQLLQQTSSIRSCEQQQTKAIDKGVPASFTNYQQSPVPIPISLADRLQ